MPFADYRSAPTQQPDAQTNIVHVQLRTNVDSQGNSLPDAPVKVRVKLTAVDSLRDDDPEFTEPQEPLRKEHSPKRASASDKVKS